jgi:hypothetical protein
MTHDERERIVEEETLRHEARHRIMERLGVQGGAACHYGVVRPSCHGCRLWAWISGILAVLLLLSLYGWRHDDACLLQRDGWTHGRSQMSTDPMQADDGQAPAKPAPKKAPAKP